VDEEMAEKRGALEVKLEQLVLDALRTSASPEAAAKTIAAQVAGLMDHVHALGLANAGRQRGGPRVRRVVRRSR